MQVDFFVRRYDIWPLTKVPDYLSGSTRLRRDTVVFSFDDGYLDNYTNALPVLEKYAIPATFFVSTAPLKNRAPYWIDELGFYLVNLNMDKAGSFNWHDQTFSSLLAKFDKTAHDRKNAASKLFGYLKACKENERSELMRGLSQCADISNKHMDTQTVDIGQLGRILKAGHEVGAHSMTHPVLSILGEKRCREEIFGSIEYLGELGMNITSFAYPFGGINDIGNLARNILASSCVKLGVTTVERAVSQQDDLFMLPRKVISAQTLGQIALRLERLAWRI